MFVVQSAHKVLTASERAGRIMKKQSTDQEHTKDGKSKKKLIIGGVIVVVIIIAIASSNGSDKTQNNNATAANTASQSQSAQSTNNAPKKPATRQVEGTATTLGAGSFTGGKDVAEGLYDVTAGAGQSGNFQVSGTDSYNEILGVSDGQGVPKVRVQISKDDQITISSLTSVTFTPVTTPFSTAHATTDLYAGTFTVGQDIGAGRYNVTPGAGQSGNFQVSGNDSYNEILGGDKSMGEVPSVTANLSEGDVITISSLSQVTFTPSN